MALVAALLDVLFVFSTGPEWGTYALHVHQFARVASVVVLVATGLWFFWEVRRCLSSAKGARAVVD